MHRYLITYSLLSSWLYIYRAYEGYEDAAYEDLLSTLRREDRPPNEAMQAGIDFENMVNACADGAQAKTEAVGAVADIVRGGQKQVALYKDKNIGGFDFLLYGRLDCLKAGTIYDIKFSKSYEVGKFLDNTQHPFYFEICPEAREFEYLVSDGTDMFREKYHRDEVSDIDRTILDFMEFLKSVNLWDLYCEKWKARE